MKSRGNETNAEVAEIAESSQSSAFTPVRLVGPRSGPTRVTAARRTGLLRGLRALGVGFRLRALGNLRSFAAALMAASVLAGCGRSSRPPDEEVTVWRPLGAWSGRGLLQTDAFISETGLLRVVWEAHGDATPAHSNAGTLRISVHSAVSGRFLALAVDQRGAGRNTVYVTEDPRSFYLLIESSDLTWSVEVAEGIPAVRRSDH